MKNKIIYILVGLLSTAGIVYADMYVPDFGTMPAIRCDIAETIYNQDDSVVTHNTYHRIFRIDDEANHILKAELISADSSDEDDNAKQAQDFLKSRYPDYTIELTKTVDADLLGGYVIRAHHKEYDRSFEGRFCQLERKLTGR